MDKVFLGFKGMEIELPDAVFSFWRPFPVESGWVVTLKGTPTEHGEEGFFETVKLARQHESFVQGSKVDDDYLWNVVLIFEDEDEATEAGIENENLFIYQIETGKLKWLS